MSMDFEAQIKAKLIEAFAPSLIQLINESVLHATHKASPGNGHSHFKLKMISQKFKKSSLIQRHQMVYRILAPFLKKGLHALSMQLDDA